MNQNNVPLELEPRIYRNGKCVGDPPAYGGPFRSIDYAAEAVAAAAAQVQKTAKNLDETITLFRGQAEAIVAYLEKLLGLSAK